MLIEKNLKKIAISVIFVIFLLIYFVRLAEARDLWSTPKRLTDGIADEIYPAFSPDNKKLAYVEQSRKDGKYFSNIKIMNVDGSESKTIFSSSKLLGICSINEITNFSSLIVSRLTWSPDGKKISFNTFCRLPNEDKVVQMVVMNADGTNPIILKAGEHPVFSPDGKKIAYLYKSSALVKGCPECPKCGKQLWIMNVDGSNDHIIYKEPENGTLFWPVFSPDGKKIVFGVWKEKDEINELSTWDLYSIDTDGTNLLRLTNDQSFDGYHVVSPDGKEILFISARSGPTELWTMSFNGSDPRQLTFSKSLKANGLSISPDGKRIAFSMSNDKTGFDIWMMTKEAVAETKPPTYVEPMYIISLIIVLSIIFIALIKRFLSKQYKKSGS
ncbi:MAG: hypothetical protein QMD36_01480 [Candidatus Aenigmarchaeota archaeon]|nr:hypothetical protein [Candidatus Aenigmarchaeota archaeon]